MTIKYLDYEGLESYTEYVKAYADDIGEAAQSYCDTAIDGLDLTDTLANYVTASSLETTLEDYATESYVGGEIAAAVSSAYEVKGSCELSGLPDDAEVGDVYNITSAFTTTSAFVEGEGAEYPAGTNVVYTSDGWDVLAGVIDLSGYVLSDDLEETLGSYVTSSSLTETLAGYVTSSSLTETLAGYVSSDGLAATLASYVTSSDLTTALASYVATADLTEITDTEIAALFE